MFRWTCLLVVTLAVAWFGWLAYDLGQEFKRASQATAAAARELEEAAKTVNRDLPEVVDRTREGTTALAEAGKTVNRDLPEIMDKTRKNADSLNQLADDVREFRKFGGLRPDRPRGETLVGYVNSVVAYIEEEGGKREVRIGRLQNPLDKRLIDGKPAKQWLEENEKLKQIIAIGAQTRSDFLSSFSMWWLIQEKGGEVMPLKDWLRANHPDSMALK